MDYKGILLYKDIPTEEWPDKAAGNFIYRIVDLPPSKQPPDSRPWRVMTGVEANQYSRELENDFENAKVDRDELTVDERIDLALDRAEKFGEKLFKRFKRGNVKSGLTKSEVRQLAKDLKDVEQLMRGGSLNALLEELSEWTNPVVTDETVLEYGNDVRKYLGLDAVDAVTDLDLGVT